MKEAQMVQASSVSTRVLMDGFGMGESPRWHDGRLWFADWGAQEIVAVDPEGESEVVVRLDFSSFQGDLLRLAAGRASRGGLRA
jgi:sugar lactone lactonase YvrE